MFFSGLALVWFSSVPGAAKRDFVLEDTNGGGGCEFRVCVYCLFTCTSLEHYPRCAPSLQRG